MSILCKLTFAQNSYVEGVVISITTSKPIPFANVQDKSNAKGVTSDSLGHFRLAVSNKTTILTVSSIGFEKTKITANSNSFVVVRLKPIAEQLSEIIIKPLENPAWEILRKVLSNADIHNPENIPQFKVDHYAKIGLDGEVLKYLKPQNIDTTLEKDKRLFIVENIGYYYQKQKKTKDIVLYSVNSFPKNYPINLLLNPEINPKSFYEPLIQVNLNQLTGFTLNSNLQNQRFYVNPINENTFSQYDLILSETKKNKNDTSYTINFEPNTKTNINGLKGFMKINSDSWAIEEVYAINADTLQTLNFEINQKYSKQETMWYPNYRAISLSYVITIDKKEIKLTYNIDDYFSNFHTNYDNSEVNFDGTNRLVLPKADAITKAEFDLLRSVDLTKKDKIIYKKAEISNERVFVQKLVIPGMAIAKTIINNGIVIGPFFLLYNQMDFNQHEKLRVGLGIQNDLQKNPRWRFYGATAYGIKDEKLKYEAIVSFHITKDRYNKIEIYGGNDIRRPGQNPMLFAKSQFRK